MEFRDLYDENRSLTNKKIMKGDLVPKGYYYITVIIMIQNNNNEFLIQKRSSEKGGKWATTGGHPVSGETSLEGLITEVKEEIGINLEKDKIKLIKTIKTDDDFVDIYYVKTEIDLKNIKLQQEEVSDIRWASVKEIESLINTNQYHKYHAKVFYDTLNYLNDNII